MTPFISQYIVFLSERLHFKVNTPLMLSTGSFVKKQINNSPFHIKTAVFFLLFILRVFIFFISLFKKQKKRGFKSTIIFINKNNIPLFKNLTRLFESLILMQILDND